MAELDKFMRECIDRAKDALEHESEQKEKAREDMRFAFVPGYQWDQHLKQKRRNRPCYEFNRIRQMIRRITGAQLKNKPQIKIRAVEDGDVETAEILNGLIRNIETTSHAEVAYDTAFHWAVGGGFGAFRICTDYEADDSFDQCIKIKPIPDPFALAIDPAAKEFDRRDARYMFVFEEISHSEFKERFPKKELVSFDEPHLSQAERYWWTKDTVRIAEYWYKEREKAKIYQLNDGTIVDSEEFDPVADEAAANGLTIVREREIERDVVKMCLVSGKEKLSEVYDWPGKYIPIVVQWGDLVTIEGRQLFSGMTRFGKDAQKLHNFELSTLIEVLAKQPNSPLTATPAMIKGYEGLYSSLGYDDPPVLPFNPDPVAPGLRPERAQPAAFPSGFANAAAIVSEELKAALGIYDASLGARSNETSGRAILARQQEGDIVNFVYVDNQAKALKYAGEIMVDLIPKIYDADRSIRIIGNDGAEKYIRVNRPIVDIQTGKTHIINDLGRGRYDVTVTIGNNYETQRMEVMEAAQAMAQIPGPFGMLAQWLLFKNMDVPGMDEFLQAVRKVLVQQGLLEPGENDQPPQPQQPNPKDIADAEYTMARAAKTQAETEKIMATLPVEIERMGAQAASSQAQAMADVSQFVPR